MDGLARRCDGCALRCEREGKAYCAASGNCLAAWETYEQCPTFLALSQAGLWRPRWEGDE